MARGTGRPREEKVPYAVSLEGWLAGVRAVVGEKAG